MCPAHLLAWATCREPLGTAGPATAPPDLTLTVSASFRSLEAARPGLRGPYSAPGSLLTPVALCRQLPSATGMQLCSKFPVHQLHPAALGALRPEMSCPAGSSAMRRAPLAPAQEALLGQPGSGLQWSHGHTLLVSLQSDQALACPGVGAEVAFRAPGAEAVTLPLAPW